MSKRFVKRIELSDDEIEHEVGLRLGEGVNTWGETLQPCLVRRGMNPEILYSGSLDIRFKRDYANGVTVFEDIT